MFTANWMSVITPETTNMLETSAGIKKQTLLIISSVVPLKLILTLEALCSGSLLSESNKYHKISTLSC